MMMVDGKREVGMRNACSRSCTEDSLLQRARNTCMRACASELDTDAAGEVGGIEIR